VGHGHDDKGFSILLMVTFLFRLLSRDAFDHFSLALKPELKPEPSRAEPELSRSTRAQLQVFVSPSWGF